MNKYVLGLSLLLTSIAQAQPEKVIVHKDGAVEIVQHHPPLSTVEAAEIRPMEIRQDIPSHPRSTFINIDYNLSDHKSNAGGLTHSEVFLATLKAVRVYINLLEKDDINFTLKVRWSDDDDAHAWVNREVVQKDWVQTRSKVQNLSADDYDPWESLIYMSLPVNTVPFIKLGPSNNDFIASVNKIFITKIQEGTIYDVSILEQTLYLSTKSFFDADFHDAKSPSSQPIDLVAAIVHEIEHLLGFVSGLSSSHGNSGTNELTFWDVFRLNSGLTAMNATAFRTENRELRKEVDGTITNAAAVLNIGFDWPLWFKKLSADGTSPINNQLIYQADHWADRQVAGEVVGLAEPRAIPGEFRKDHGNYLYRSDIRAIDLMGYVINESGWDDVGPPLPVSPIQDSMHDSSQNLQLDWLKDSEATTSDVIIYDLGVAAAQRIGSSENGSFAYRKNDILDSSLTISSDEIALIPGHKYQWHATVYQPLGYQRTDPATFIVAGGVGPVGPCADQFESAKLLPANGGDLTLYAGTSVAISGDIAVVGAAAEDNGRAGRAYVYSRDGSRWVHEDTLFSSDSASQGYFGGSVSIDGDVIAVGAYGESNGDGAVYVYRNNGVDWIEEDQLSETGSIWFGRSVSVSGSRVAVGASESDNAFVYEYDGSGSWNQIADLVALDGTGVPIGGSHEYGHSVSIDNDLLVVGAYNAKDAGGVGSGAAYVYRFDGISSWNQETMLSEVGLDGAADFGISVSTSNNRVLVGAIGADVFQNSAGAAYVYSYSGTAWTQDAVLGHDNPSSGDQFGETVSISGDLIVVGADFVNGNGVNDSGAAFTFHFVGGNWVKRNTLLTSVGDVTDYFAHSVAVSGDTIIGGAWWDSDFVPFSGSAYIFEFNTCPVDIVKDGMLNFFDVSEFLQQYNAQTGLGDWNCDGVVNPFDVLKFNNDFAAGCP